MVIAPPTRCKWYVCFPRFPSHGTLNLRRMATGVKFAEEVVRSVVNDTQQKQLEPLDKSRPECHWKMDDSCNKLLIFGRSMWIYWNYWVLSQFFWGYLLVIKRECPPYLQPFGCHSPHKCFLGNSKCHVSMAGIRRVSHAPQSFGVGTRVILFSCLIRKVERMVAVCSKNMRPRRHGDRETTPINLSDTPILPNDVVSFPTKPWFLEGCFLH